MNTEELDELQKKVVELLNSFPDKEGAIREKSIIDEIALFLQSPNDNDMRPYFLKCLGFGAAFKGYLDIIKNLIEKDCTFSEQDEEGLTPLHHALSQGHLDVATLLIEKGFNINAQNKEGLTPLHYSLREGHLDIATLLIEKGCILSAQDNKGLTPLHYALREGHLDIANLLIEEGCDINAKSASQSTPLHEAAFKGYLEIIKYLIEEGCDINSKAKNEHTALHIAAKLGHLNVVEYLIAQDCDINAKNHREHTLLSILLKNYEENESAQIKFLILSIIANPSNKVNILNQEDIFLQNYNNSDSDSDSESDSELISFYKQLNLGPYQQDKAVDQLKKIDNNESLATYMALLFYFLNNLASTESGFPDEALFFKNMLKEVLYKFKAMEIVEDYVIKLMFTIYNSSDYFKEIFLENFDGKNSELIPVMVNRLVALLKDNNQSLSFKQYNNIKAIIGHYFLKSNNPILDKDELLRTIRPILSSEILENIKKGEADNFWNTKKRKRQTKILDHKGFSSAPGGKLSSSYKHKKTEVGYPSS